MDSDPDTLNYVLKPRIGHLNEERCTGRESVTRVKASVTLSLNPHMGLKYYDDFDRLLKASLFQSS